MVKSESGMNGEEERTKNIVSPFWDAAYDFSGGIPTGREMRYTSR